MKVIDWTPIYKKYKGMWVALAGDEKTVVASAKSVKETIQLASKNGETKPILLKVPLKQLTYVGYGHGIKLQLQKN